MYSAVEPLSFASHRIESEAHFITSFSNNVLSTNIMEMEKDKLIFKRV